MNRKVKAAREVKQKVVRKLVILFNPERFKLLIRDFHHDDDDDDEVWKLCDTYRSTSRHQNCNIIAWM
jgi:hypothetical protein